MLGRFATCNGTVMASVAGLWRSAKYTINVARFAGHKFMWTQQLKARCQVVEIEGFRNGRGVGAHRNLNE